MSIQQIFDAYNISVSSREIESFVAFLRLFQEYNAHTNLSAIRDDTGIVEKHFADSLMIEQFVSIHGRVLDIGTGGWFPGIPLAIRHPDAEFVLLDSVGKKIRACDHFVRELTLANISTIHGRAEEIAQEVGFFNSFDLVVSRATAYLPQILEWALPFLTPDGQIVLYKLPSEEERKDGMRAMNQLGLELVREESYTLAKQERVLLFFSRSKK